MSDDKPATPRSAAVLQIRELLEEPQSEASVRERATFLEQLRGTSGRIVIFGAGHLGRLCLRACGRAKVRVHAFCDSDHGKHGTKLEGISILSPHQAARDFGGDALFIVGIWTGTAVESMFDRIAYLNALGCRFVVPFPALLWAYGEADLPFHSFERPSNILSNAAALNRLSTFLADDLSVEVLQHYLLRGLRGYFMVEQPSRMQYLPVDILRLRDTETFVDCGAYNGDTLDLFVEYLQKQGSRYFGFEPDPKTFEALSKKLKPMPPEVGGRCQVFNSALGEVDSVVFFTGEGKPNSRVDPSGSVPVRTSRLDNFNFGLGPTYIKMDVEGHELAVLRGGKTLIEQRRPSLAVCVYHLPNDIWEIPLMIKAMLPEQPVYLRAHGLDGWETVCYSIAPQHQRSNDNIFPA